MNFNEISVFMNTPILHIANSPVTLGGIGAGFLVFIGALIFSSIIQNVIARRLDKNPKITSGMTYTFRRIVHYIIIFAGLVIATQCVGINLGSLAVAFGFLGVGIGLGLQNITSNFVAGLIILLERPITIGDFVNMEGTIGEVVNINMRATEIMTIDNITIVVPNSKFVEHNVINWSLKDLRVRLHCPVGVAYGSDIGKVKEALYSVAKEHPDVLKEPEPEVRFLAFGDSSLNFDLLVWIENPRKQFIVRSQINYMIDEAFRKAAVRIPFPQRDVHVQMTEAIKELSDGTKS
jgi:potassium-dependent mechanosensitive channel